MQVLNEREQVSLGVSVPRRDAMPLANAIMEKSHKSIKYPVQ